MGKARQECAAMEKRCEVSSVWSRPVLLPRNQENTHNSQSHFLKILVGAPVPAIIFSCPGRIFSYCVRARAYTHVLARVYSTRASTCTIYTCLTLPHTRVNLTGLQL